MDNGIAYGYGVQIAPGTDISTICPSMKKMKQLSYKNHDYICYRPIVEADNQERVLNGFEVSESGYKADGIVVLRLSDIIEPYVSEDNTEYISELDFTNMANSFEFMNWYLIPTKNGEPVYELNNESSNYDTTVAPAADCEYWFTHADFSVGGAPIQRFYFYEMLYTAREKEFGNFKIKYNAEDKPVVYGYVGSWFSDFAWGDISNGLLQIIPVEELEKVFDVRAEAVRMAANIHSTDEKLIQAYIDDIMQYEYYYWTKSENLNPSIPQFQENVVYRYTEYDRFKGYYMIPLDKEGNEIWQVNC